MPDLDIATGRIVKEAIKKLSPVTYLMTHVRTMKREILEELVVAYLLSQVEQRKRASSRSVERASERPVYAPIKTPVTPSPEQDEVPEQSELELALAAEGRRRELDAQIMIARNVSRIELLLNDELLRSQFSLGDGTKTTWGEATQADHLVRYEMYKTNLIADAEGAARHKKAIELLEASGAPTLNELVKESAHV